MGDLQPVWLALITFAASSLAIAIPRWFDGRRKTRDAAEARLAREQEIAAARQAKQEDWAREDAVAKKAEEAATLLLERQALDSKEMAKAAQLLLQRQQLDSTKTEEAARLLLAANERVAANSGELNVKLDVIHALVNNEKTQGMLAQLDETKRGLVSLREIVSLHQAAGRQPSVEAIGVIKATEERIDKLQAAILDREQQQAMIDAKASSQKTAP